MNILNPKANLSPPSIIRPSYRGVPKTSLKLSGNTRQSVPLEKTEPDTKERRIPGIQKVKVTGGFKYRAYIQDNGQMRGLGEFQTQERAFLTLRLFKLWRRRGMSDIPNKPSFRLYTRSDKS